MSTRATGVVATTYGGTGTFTAQAPVPSWPRKALVPRIPLAWLYGVPTGAQLAASNTPGDPITPSVPPSSGDCGCG